MTSIQKKPSLIINPINHAVKKPSTSTSSSVSKTLVHRLSQNKNSFGHQHEKLSDKNVTPIASSQSLKGQAWSLIKDSFNWTCHTRPVKWGAVQTLKLARFGLTFHSSPENSKSKNESELSKLTGSQHLTKLLQTLALPSAKALQEILVDLCSEDDAKSFILKEFLKKELPALDSLIRTMLPAITLHLVNYARECIYEEVGKYPKTISLLDIISCLSDLIKNHLPRITERIQRLEGKADSSKREQKILQLFIPLTDELLAILLPDGPNDLPLAKLPFTPNYTWKLLRNEIMPSVLMTIYQKLTAPFNRDDGEKLKAYPGGESLVNLCEIVGDESGECIPSLLEEESPLLEGISTITHTLCEGKSSQFKQWLSRWLVRQIQNIATNEHKEIRSVFNFCGKYLEPCLLHIFRNLAAPPVTPEQAQGLLPDSLGIISIKVLTVLSDFMNTYGEKIADRWRLIKSSELSPQEDPELLEMFCPLANELIRITGLDDYSQLPVPDFLQQVVGTAIHAAAPKFLLEQYQAIQEGSIDDEDLRKKFRSFFFDEKKLQDPSIGTHIINFLHNNAQSHPDDMFNKFYQQLWQESGTEHIARTLEGMCAVFANNFIDSTLLNLGISPQNALKCDKNPFMKSTSKYLKVLTETTMLRILIQIFTTTPENVTSNGVDHPQKLLPINVFMRLLESGSKGLKNIDENLKEIDKVHSNNPTAHALEKRKIFTKLADDLHTMSGANPFSNLPFGGLPAGDSFKELLWQTVRTTVLPDVLAAQFDDLTEWDRQLQNSFDELENCYHTSHPQWACKVLAQYTTDFIRHYMATGQNESAKLIFEALQTYFKTSISAKSEATNDLFEQQSLEIQSLLARNLFMLGDYQEAPMTDIWPVLTRYFEGVIAKFLAGFSSTVKDIEANNPDFMIDIAINMLKDTADYFKIVNDIVQQVGEEHAYNINPATIITGFREHLHDGVPTNPSAPESEKDQTRLQGCFIPRAMHLLELANITIKNFPLPSTIRQPLGELIVGTILPIALLRADQNALSHQVRDALMLNFVQTLYTTLNGSELIKEEEVVEEHKIATDPKQKRLNETCGFVVLELVKLIPDTMVQYVFMKEKVQNMSAEAIGEAIMPFLSRWTLLQLIDTVMYVSLPSLHPAKWEGKAGRETLVPRKAFIKPNGKMALKPVRKFKFHFPKTSMEIQEDEFKQLQVANKTRLQLRDGFTIIISNQLRIKLWEAVKTVWNQFQGQLDVFVERQFPGKGLEMKHFLDNLFHKVCFDLIGRVVQFLSLPVVNSLEYLIQKIYIDRKSKEIIENIHSDALENLLYKWMDTLVNTLLKLKPTLPPPK